MKPLIVAASAAIFGSAIPLVATAQEAAIQPGVYASLGYADTHIHGANLGALAGRLGYRFNTWMGLEGEFAAGMGTDDFRTLCSLLILGPCSVRSRLETQAAIYGVGFLPIAPNWDLIGRVGYGQAKVKLKDVPIEAGPSRNVSIDDNSWNYGVGAQYHWDDANGVRADYTRETFRGNDLDHADVWSIAYTRRF